MTRRFAIAAALALPLLVLVMADMAGAHLFAPRSRVMVELALATPVCTWAAWHRGYERHARWRPHAGRIA